MDVRLPDGTVIQGVPDGTTKAQLAAKLKANGMAVPDDWMPEAQKAAPKMQPVGVASEMIDGIPRMLPRQRATPKQDATQSFAQNVIAPAASLVVGPLMGLAARTAGAAPRVVSALSSSGFTTGAAPVGFAAKAGDMALRTGAGASTGAVSAALSDPADWKAGAAIGAATPGVLKVGGAIGGALASGWRQMRNPTDQGARELARALGLLTPEQRAEAVQRLRAAQELVPGARPTLAQAMQTPESAVLEKVIADSPGAGRLQRVLKVEQPAARAAALEGVAPTAPGGYQAARQDMGAAIAGYAVPARSAARAETRAAYEAVPQDEAALYLPDLGVVRDKYFGPGSFTSREAADKAVSTAQKIGTEQVSGIVPVTAGAAPKTLAQAVRSAGGLNMARNDGMGAELTGLRGDLKNLVFNRSGMTPSRMAQRMHEAGYIADDSADTLFQALKTDARSGPQYSAHDLPERQWAAAREAGMGAPPVAEGAPKKVTLREFDNLRKSIGQVQRAAAADPARAAEAAALSDMKATLDRRLNEVVAGDGKADEVLPIAWANALDKARTLKLDEVKRFMTGPQSAIFRTGSDGQPLVQGGEVAAKFWGNRPGVAEDVDSFRRLIADNPRLLGQFRSMVTTEGMGREAGKEAPILAANFSKWVQQNLPGLKAAFEPPEVKTLQNIAADINRNLDVTRLAAARAGSDTYQKASNALSLGLLDSPALNRAAGLIPGVRYVAEPALEGARSVMRTAKSNRLAELLSDSGEAANALALIGPDRRGLASNALVQSLYRLPPALIGGL